MLKVVSLYTGVGGLDFGFEAAGFQTTVAVDIDPVCCETLGRNRKWKVLHGDIQKIRSRYILEKTGDVDVLIGGPPCQPFSKSSYWVSGDTNRLDDPRARTLDAYLRVVRDLQPKAFVLENVQGLTYDSKDEGLKHLLYGIERINRSRRTQYTVSCETLDAAEYGVPQHRKRVFLVASRDGKKFNFPDATHGPVDRHVAQSPLEPYRTAWDAIGDLPRKADDAALQVGGKWGDLLPSIPEGESYLWHTSRGGGKPLFGWRTRYWTFLLKLAKDRPSWTIQASPGTATGPFHWTNRRLSPQELCRLQTFPKDVTFNCSQRDVQRMLGNAVPSLLAEILAREIRHQLFGGKRFPEPLKLLPPRRVPIPPREKLRSVPRQYDHLMGTHEDHPGEGKGPGALKRLASAALVVGGTAALVAVAAWSQRSDNLRHGASGSAEDV